MITSVMIEDYASRSANYTIYDDDDLAEITKVWTIEDPLLVALRDTSIFENTPRWCDLRPWHFKFLITQTLEKMFELPAKERDNPENPVMKSIDFIISALLYCLWKNSDVRVEFMKIQRIDTTVVNFDYRGSIMLEPTKSEPKPGLQLAVDNSK